MNTDSKIVLGKLQHFCAYKERCVIDIREKLSNYDLKESEKENIIEKLLAEDFINEIRFTESFVRSKFSYNNWGRIKIRYALMQKGISSTIIENALQAIDEDEYHRLIEKLIQKKELELVRRKKINLAGKIMKYMQAKGFEKSLVYPSLKNIP